MVPVLSPGSRTKTDRRSLEQRGRRPPDLRRVTPLLMRRWDGRPAASQKAGAADDAFVFDIMLLAQRGWGCNTGVSWGLEGETPMTHNTTNTSVMTQTK